MGARHRSVRWVGGGGAGRAGTVARVASTGRVALVTGVSRSAGIGAAVVRRLLDAGLRVVASGWPPHDDEQPWGGGWTGLPDEVAHEVRDLADPTAPSALVDEVVDRHGRLDVVVAAHARSSAGGLGDVSAAELDACWAVNVRAVVLLAQRFAEVRAGRDGRADGRADGRMIWFTSGQHLGPMEGELAYAVTKGALHQLTASLDRALAPSGVAAVCVNPGPVDTGWADAAAHDVVARRFPSGRWPAPDATARLVQTLVGELGEALRGRVLDAESGFDRFA